MPPAPAEPRPLPQRDHVRAQCCHMRACYPQRNYRCPRDSRRGWGADSCSKHSANFHPLFLYIPFPSLLFGSHPNGQENFLQD